MNANTQATADTIASDVAVPAESSNVWWRRLGVLLCIGSAVVVYGGLYLLVR